MGPDAVGLGQGGLSPVADKLLKAVETLSMKGEKSKPELVPTVAGSILYNSHLVFQMLKRLILE